MIIGLVVKKGAETLADGDPHLGAVLVDMGHGQQRAFDPSRPVLADVVAFIDLITQEGEASFAVSRQHASAALGLDHYFRHPQSVLGKADLVIEFTDADEVLHTWTAPDCAWRAARAPSLPPGGLHTSVQYTVGVTAFAYANSEETPLSAAERNYQLLEPDEAGNTTIGLAGNIRVKRLLVQAAAGVGAYTHKVIIPETNRAECDEVNGRLEFTASANATVEFRSGSAGGDLLGSRTGVAMAATAYAFSFVWDGATWQPLWILNQPL